MVIVSRKGTFNSVTGDDDVSPLPHELALLPFFHSWLSFTSLEC